VASKMKNKLLYYAIIAVAVAVLSAYFAFNNPFKKDDQAAQNAESETEENGQMENAESGQLEGQPASDTGNNSKESLPAGQTSHNIVTGDFEITPPPGWEGRPAPEGVLAIAIKPSEVISDPEASKMGFRSYFAVTKDNLQGKTREEYVSFIGEELKKISSSVTLDTSWSTKVDGKDATVLDISMDRDNVDFKASIFLVWSGEDVWAIAFNTTEDKWDEYKDSFFTSGSSFKLK